jgi:hypothetical protein
LQTRFYRSGQRLAVGLLAAAMGCQHGATPQQVQRHTEHKIAKEIAEDRGRLAGEDAPAAGPRIGPVNVSPLHGLLVEFPRRVFRLMTGRTPAVAATRMENTRSADQRRQGIFELASYRFGRHDPYTRRYQQIAAADPDPTVRAAAIRALNRSRSREAIDLYVRSLDDVDLLVRLEGAKAVANVPAPNAVAPLIAHLKVEDSRDVRIACADALRNIRTLESARALVGALNDRDFGVAWQARKSLIVMTRHDFRYDEAAWLSYLSQSQRPFG